MTKTDEFELIRPDPNRHRQDVLDLTAKTFGRGYWEWMQHARDRYIDHSPYDWSASTIGILAGRAVTHWGAWDIAMRVGRAAIRVAGIGAVSTDARFRKRGLMARTIAGAMAPMRRAGYDMTLLYGIPGFYHRFGYVPAWPGQVYHVATGALPTDPPAGRVRRFVPNHRDDLARLYNRQHAGLTGTAVRPVFLRARKGWTGRLWTDDSGSPTGYLVIGSRQDTLELIDSAGEPGQILRVLGRLARRRGARRIRLPDLHHDSGLARLLRRGDCRLERNYSRSGEAMIHLLNLTSTLERMEGELEARLRRSHLADWRGRLLIAREADKAVLQIDRSKVRLVPPGRGAVARHTIRGGEHIAGLLIGRDEPGEVIEAGGLRLRGDASKLVDVLLPNQHPCLGTPDTF
jgi:predicted N-acetyltransferase YhbS